MDNKNNKEHSFKAISYPKFESGLIRIDVLIDGLVIVRYCERYHRAGNILILMKGPGSWYQDFGLYNIKSKNYGYFKELTLEETGLDIPSKIINSKLRKLLKQETENASNRTKQ